MSPESGRRRHSNIEPRPGAASASDAPEQPKQRRYVAGRKETEPEPTSSKKPSSPRRTRDHRRANQTIANAADLVIDLCKKRDYRRIRTRPGPHIVDLADLPSVALLIISWPAAEPFTSLTWLASHLEIGTSAVSLRRSHQYGPYRPPLRHQRFRRYRRLFRRR